MTRTALLLAVIFALHSLPATAYVVGEGCTIPAGQYVTQNDDNPLDSELAQVLIAGDGNDSRLQGVNSKLVITLDQERNINMFLWLPSSGPLAHLQQVWLIGGLLNLFMESSAGTKLTLKNFMAVCSGENLLMAWEDGQGGSFYPEAGLLQAFFSPRGRGGIGVKLVRSNRFSLFFQTQSVNNTNLNSTLSYIEPPPAPEALAEPKKAPVISGLDSCAVPNGRYLAEQEYEHYILTKNGNRVSLSRITLGSLSNFFQESEDDLGWVSSACVGNRLLAVFHDEQNLQVFAGEYQPRRQLIRSLPNGGFNYSDLPGLWNTTFVVQSAEEQPR